MKFFLCLITVFAIYTCSANEKNIVRQQTEVAIKKDKLVLTGLGNLLQNKIDLLKGKRVGLLTNPSGVNRELKSTVDLFYENVNINLSALYGPEHGIRGAIQGGSKVANEKDPKTGLTIFSLYGKTTKPTAQMLDSVDVIVVDIQDVGVRSYTYIYTMSKVLEAAAENDKEVIVLDHPNPMGGSNVEGNIVHKGYFSMVGLYPLAYRHGMTIGELANYFNEEFSIHAKLTVVPMLNWKRNMIWPDTQLPWVPTSPNVPHWDIPFLMTATGTIGELYTISVGIGYTLPFGVVGGPWINGDQFAKALNDLQLPGIIFRPLYFKPGYFLFSGEFCRGVQLYITDYSQFKPFVTGLYIIQTCMKLYPDIDLFSNKNRLNSFNRVMGSDIVANDLMAGKPVTEIEAEWQNELDDFLTIRQKYLLY